MTFRPNPHAARALAHEPSVRAGLHSQAERVKQAAEQAAPHGATGGYARRFTIDDDDETVRVGNTDIAAHLIEFGSVNNPPYAPLRRGARAAGLRLDE